MKFGKFVFGMGLVTLLGAAAIALLKGAQGFCEGFFSDD